MLEETIKRIKEEEAIKLAGQPLNIIETGEGLGQTVIPILPKNDRGGRKKQSHYRTEAIQRLHENVLDSVEVIKQAVNAAPHITWLQFQAATYNIDQVVGKSKVKIEADMSDRSYDRLLKLALETQRQLPEGTIDAEFEEIDVTEQEEEQAEDGGVQVAQQERAT